MPAVKVYLGLGSNLGDRRANLVRGLELLSQVVTVERVSSIYETEPVDCEAPDRFLNAVCRARTTLAPEALLAEGKRIEAALGRRPAGRNAPRPFDVDILFYGKLVMSTPELTVPHPRLAERAFVLVPLAEIAPALRHPVTGETARQMLAKVDTSGVRKMGTLPRLRRRSTGSGG